MIANRIGLKRAVHVIPRVRPHNRSTNLMSRLESTTSSGADKIYTQAEVDAMIQAKQNVLLSTLGLSAKDEKFGDAFVISASVVLSALTAAASISVGTYYLLDKKLDEVKSDLKTEIGSIKVDIREEFKEIKQDVREVRDFMLGKRASPLAVEAKDDNKQSVNNKVSEQKKNSSSWWSR